MLTPMWRIVSVEGIFLTMPCSYLETPSPHCTQENDSFLQKVGSEQNYSVQPMVEIEILA